VDPLPPSILSEIQQFDTCTIANAIEHFGVRLRNTGYTQPGLQCLTGGYPRMAGYAATCRVKTADPPMTGNAYVDRTDWWEAIGRLPAPRIAVIQDMERNAGGGSTLGQVHAAVLQAFECCAAITNGSVRDLEGLAELKFPVFAHSVAVSHAYAHVVDFGQPVEIFGLTVEAGDLLYADCHGVISIPQEIAAEAIETARRIQAHDRKIIDLCRSSDFTIKKLQAAIRE